MTRSRVLSIALLALVGVLAAPAPAPAALYVGSNGTDQVLAYDGITGAFLGVFASGGGLDLPTGLAFGPGGDLFVSSAGTGQVLRYDGATGVFEGVFASGSGLDNPVFLVFGPDPVAAVPEPASVLLGLGAAGLGLRRLRRRA